MAHPLLLMEFHSQSRTWPCCFTLWVYQPTCPVPPFLLMQKQLPRVAA